MSQSEATIYILPDDTEFRLDDTESARYLAGVSGLGMPALLHTTRRGYGQDGETWLGTQLQKRVINLSVAEVYAGRAAMWDGHMTWFAAMIPGDNAGKLRKVFPDGRKFDLDVRFQGGADAGAGERFGKRVQSYVLQLVALNPIWRNSDECVLTAETYEGDQLVLPFELPMWLDGTNILGYFDVDYAGSWRAWPEIALDGPMINPVVEHVEHEIEVQLLDTISDGDTVTIALDPAYPTVTDQYGNDWTGRLSEISDLAGFYLVSGTNTIRVRAAGVTGSSRAILSYYEQYVGV